MDFTLTLSDKPQILALQSLKDEFNKLRAEDNQVDETGYLQEVLNGMVHAASVQFNTDVIEIDKQIAELQARRAEIVAK